MFDSVHGRCPHCKVTVELQSKSGECSLDTFSLDSVPALIAYDLAISQNEWNITCVHCGKTYRLVINNPSQIIPDRVSCSLITEKEYEARKTKLGKILYE